MDLKDFRSGKQRLRLSGFLENLRTLSEYIVSYGLISTSSTCHACLQLKETTSRLRAARYFDLRITQQAKLVSRQGVHNYGSGMRRCAPGGMRSVHDKLYNDYCTHRFPATQSVYFSEERCSLLPGVECAS